MLPRIGDLSSEKHANIGERMSYSKHLTSVLSLRPTRPRVPTSSSASFNSGISGNASWGVVEFSGSGIPEPGPNGASRATEISHAARGAWTPHSLIRSPSPNGAGEATENVYENVAWASPLGVPRTRP
jgi:hypothetical protein